MFDRHTRSAKSGVASPSAAPPVVASPPLTLGSRRDSTELDADRAATAVLGNERTKAPLTPRALSRESSPTSAATPVPESVHTALQSRGQPLDGSVQSFMEQRFDHRFSDVRVHDNAVAASSARDVHANAYTVGKQIVFAGGRYVPSSPSGRWLLAHELAHVVQNSQIAKPQIVRRQHAAESTTAMVPKPAAQTATQAASTTTTATSAAAVIPRQDFVFIMGADTAGSGNPFYTMAERYYRAHVPGATFVTTVRNLTDLLSWISTNVKAPIGNLYIVSHANEDGTLSFALNTADKDTRLSVPELRGELHPAGGGATTMASVSAQVDATTRIHIKGCDIGRTQEMVELLDEAFGGAGTVTAPTHEQVFGTDPTLEAQARAQFRASVEANHPMPPPVDPLLKGADKTKAVADRTAAVKQRTQDVQAELTARKPEEDKLAEEANTYEAFSGPMFQRTGTTLFTAAEIKPQVDTLYAHLSDADRAKMVAALVAADARSAAVANSQGTFQQHGQRVYRRTPLTYTLEEPQTAAEATKLYQADFAANNFTATGPPVITRTPVSGGFTMAVVVPGTSSPPGQTSRDTTRTFNYTKIDDDATLIAKGRLTVPNPERYAWRVTTAHATTGITTRSVVGERVVAYLHHGSLDASAHAHFDRPESNSSFFATSTFAPAPPPPASGGATTTGGPVP